MQILKFPLRDPDFGDVVGVSVPLVPGLDFFVPRPGLDACVFVLDYMEFQDRTLLVAKRFLACRMPEIRNFLWGESDRVDLYHGGHAVFTGDGTPCFDYEDVLDSVLNQGGAELLSRVLDMLDVTRDRDDDSKIMGAIEFLSIATNIVSNDAHGPEGPVMELVRKDGNRIELRRTGR